MAKTKISEFSATPGNNTDIDGINIAEGCAPSGINDAIRELMSQLKDFQAGTAGDSFNGPVGTTTAAAGAFTTLSASSTVSGTGFSTYLASPPAIGGTTAAAGSFTTLTTSSTVTHNGGTANGVAYLNGSKVLTTGSALQFDGSNLGLGVTPSAWSGYTGFQVKSTSVAGIGTSDNGFVGSNVYYNGSAFTYMNSTTATLYRQLAGSHSWHVAPSGTAGNAISFTQAMTLDADRRWFLNTTTGVGTEQAIIAFNSAGSYTQALNTRDTNASANGNSHIVLRRSDDTYLGALGRSGTDTAMFVDGNSYLALRTANTERARIDSSGNLLVNTTSAIGRPGISSQLAVAATSGRDASYFLQTTNFQFAITSHVNTTSGTRYHIGFGDGTTWTERGTISTNGTSTTYSTSSDYRLKENIQPMTGALAKVAALKPCTYKWKADGSDGEGFIAHELAEVVPQCVTGEKDAVDEEGKPVYQGIDTSFLVATLTAAIQELKAEFDAYKATHP